MKEQKCVKPNNASKAGILAGIVLLFAGTLLILQNFGLLPVGMRKVLFSWPMLLCLLGIIHLVYHHYYWGDYFTFGGNIFYFTSHSFCLSYLIRRLP